MTERGLPTADGAPACPFVAFDDDRDSRATAPDHRHRCFAEPVPAPRALAHQDAYCLSPAFAVCPAFQDWARREAAAARPGAGASTGRAYDEDTSGPSVMPPPAREPRHAPAAAAAPAAQRKPPARDWAAPPPWVPDGDAVPGQAPATAAPGAIPGWGAAAAGAAAVSASRARDDWRDGSKGLADSPAARMAGPDPDLPTPARPQKAWTQAPGDDRDDDADDRDDLPPVRPAPVSAAVPVSRSAALAPASSRAVPPPRTPSPRDGAKPAVREPEELFGPAWERPRRYEAYPSLRTRVGLPSFAGVPRIAVMAGALVVAALLLFFVAPMILGLGGKSPSAGTASPTPFASAAPTDSLAPTVAPAPTSYTYTVIKGDTLGSIAAKNHVTISALLKANPKIKNPNQIRVGDQLTIPAPAGAAPSGAVGGASPSPVVGASPSG